MQIFPDGYIINTPYLDTDSIKPYTQNWDVELGNIDKNSSLQIRFNAFHTPKIQCSFAQYTAGIFIKGHSPKECIIISFCDTDGIVNFQNKRLSKNELIISSSRTNLDLISNKDIDIYTLAVEKALLYDICKEYFGCSYEDIKQDDKLKIYTKDTIKLQNYFQEWIRLYTDPHMLNLISNLYDKIEKEILHTVLSMLDVSYEKKENKKYKLLRDIKQIMYNNIKNDLKIYQITEILGISQRTLEYLFKEQMGITPKQYYHALRMNYIRNTLLNATTNIKISDIAKECGFYHQSHFASIYKQMYKESPKETLKKNIGLLA